MYKTMGCFIKEDHVLVFFMIIEFLWTDLLFENGNCRELTMNIVQLIYGPVHVYTVKLIYSVE